MHYCANSGIVKFIFHQKIVKKSKNRKKNKIILMKMPLLKKTKPVTLLRVKAQVQTFSVTEAHENNPK